MAYNYEAPAYIDSDSQSSSSHYQEYQDSPSPSSDKGDSKHRDSLPLVPLSGTKRNTEFSISNCFCFLFSIQIKRASILFFYLHPLSSLKERERSDCSSSFSRCSRRRQCGAAYGGCSHQLAPFSSPPRTKSVWPSYGAVAREIARPWPTKRWPEHSGTTPALGRLKRWNGSSPINLMKRHWKACKETQRHSSVMVEDACREWEKLGNHCGCIYVLSCWFWLQDKNEYWVFEKP